MSLVGVDTAVTCDRAGVFAPTLKELTDRALLVLLALSVTLMVQLSYVPSLKPEELSDDCVRVTVLFPDIAEDGDELPQAPPYVIVPASVEEKV